MKKLLPLPVVASRRLVIGLPWLRFLLVICLAGGGWPVSSVGASAPLAAIPSASSLDRAGSDVVAQSQDLYTVQLPALQDTEIGPQQDAPWGNETTLYVYQGKQPTNVWWSLFQFDLSALPPGAQIISARLRLYTMFTDRTPISVHQISAAWDAQVDSWSTFSAHHVAEPTASFAPVAASTPVFVDVTWLVRQWHTGQAPNYGLLLKAMQANGESRFASMESGDSFLHPRLEVTIQSSTLRTVADDFDPDTGFTGSDGAVDWLGPWQEIGENDGTDVGFVQVLTRRGECDGGDCLTLLASNQDVTGLGIQRALDLAGASHVNLHFDIRRTGSGGEVAMEISPDGGATWTTLAIYVLNTPDSDLVPQVFDISAYATDQTVVRWIASGQFKRDTGVYVDNVRVDFLAQAVGGRVWHDQNRNSQQDPGEAGLPGVRLRLFANQCALISGPPQATTFTDPQGEYLFPVATTGNYCIVEDAASLPVAFGPTGTAKSPLDVYNDGGLTRGADLGFALLEGYERLSVGVYAPCTDIAWLEDLAQSHRAAFDGQDFSTCAFSLVGEATDMATLRADLETELRSRYGVYDGWVTVAYTPNDPDYNNPSIVYGPQQINAPQAWDITLGDPGIIVAVLDTGIDRNHPEFAGRLLPGYDFANDDADPTDDNGHGTHVAGIIAAGIDNSLGMAGVAGRVTILPVKVLNASNAGWWSDISQGISYAVDQGAKVINLSLGAANGSQSMQDAIAYAVSKGVVVVAAAGNSNSSQLFYPASYPESLAVGATDYSGVRWSLSNYGDNVDMMAPGALVYSTYWTAAGGSDFSFMSGTSMATPHVAGAVALLFSINPNVTPAQVRELLYATAVDLGSPGVDIYYGNGLINVGAAAQQLEPAVLIPPATEMETILAVDVNEDGQLDPGDTLRYLIHVANLNPAPLEGVVVSATVPAGATYLLGSTRINAISAQDNLAPASALPLDEGGLTLGPVLAGGETTVSFDVVVGQLPVGQYRLDSTATITTPGEQVDLSASTEVAGTLLHMAVDLPSAASGDILHYTFTSDYVGQELLQDVVISASVPAGTTLLPASMGADGVAESGRVEWNLGSNAPAIPGYGLTQPGSETILLEAVADSFIDSNAPGANYGTASSMLTYKLGGRERWSLLQFDLSAIPANRTIITATLELEALSTSDTAAIPVDLYASAGIWDENIVTWTNFGQKRVATPASTSTVGGAGLYQWDATALARSWQAGSTNNQGLVLATGVNGSNKDFATREYSGAVRPRLRIFIASETILEAVADTYIDASSAGTNYGTSTIIKVDDLGSKPVWSLVRFDLASIPPHSEIIQSQLRMHLVSSTFVDPVLHFVYQANREWGESAVTWGNFGDGLGSLLDTQTVGDLGVYGWNITPAARQWYQDSQSNRGVIVTLTPASNNSPKWYASREDGDAGKRPSARLAYALPQAHVGNVMAAGPTLATSGSLITVTQTISASMDLADVAPLPLTITATQGVSAALVSGPTPAKASVGPKGQTFTWVYRVTAADNVGQLTFGGGAHNGYLAWPAAQSNSVIVHPPLTFAAQVVDPPTVNRVRATAQIGESGERLPSRQANSVTTDLTGSIGDLVWYDMDGDAIQDADEPGIPGVRVVLTASQGGSLTTTTDSTGRYRFNFLGPDTYVISLDPASVPELYTLVSTLYPFTVELGVGQGANYADMGLSARAISVGDRVWYDVNADGVQDPHEPGLGNVSLALYRDEDGDSLFNPGRDYRVDSTVSNAAGEYRLDAPAPGNYFVQVTDEHGVLAGLAHTVGSQSMGDPTPLLSLSAGEIRLDVDFGYVLAAPEGYGVIGDLIWLDGNANGVREPQEAILSQVEVCAQALSGGDALCAMSDLNGRYLLAVPAGIYEVAPSQAPLGLTATIEQPRLVNALYGGHDLTVDFGYQAPAWAKAGISGQVWQDLPSAGVFDGMFDPALEPGIPNVSVNVIRDMNQDGVWDAGEPFVANTTSVDGVYIFNSLLAGSYLVQVVDTLRVLRNFAPTVPGLAGSSDQANREQPYALQLESGQMNSSADFGYREYDAFAAEALDNPGVIGDLVFLDVDGDGIYRESAGDRGIPGVTLALYRAGVLAATTTSGNDGRYLFTDLLPGSYQVEVTDHFGVLNAYQSTVGSQPGVNNQSQSQPYSLFLGLNPSNLTADFGYMRLVTVGDHIWWDVNGDGLQSADEPGMPGVPVELRDGAGNLVAATTSGNEGQYLFSELLPISYTVGIPAHAFEDGGALHGWSFSPNQAGPDTIDSDGESQFLGSRLLEPAVGEQMHGLDFGFTIPSQVAVAVNGPPVARYGSTFQVEISVTNLGSTWVSQIPVSLVYSSTYLSVLDTSPVGDNSHADEVYWIDGAGAAGLSAAASDELGPGMTATLLVTFQGIEDSTALPDETIPLSVTVLAGYVDPDGSAGLLPPLPILGQSSTDGGVSVVNPTAVQVMGNQAQITDEGVRLTWRTVDESQIAGFRVWRQAGAAAAALVTPHPLAAQHGGQPTGADYSFLDPAPAAELAHYTLEILTGEGLSQFTPLGGVGMQNALYLPIIGR